MGTYTAPFISEHIKLIWTAISSSVLGIITIACVMIVFLTEFDSTILFGLAGIFATAFFTFLIWTLNANKKCKEFICNYEEKLKEATSNNETLSSKVKQYEEKINEKIKKYEELSSRMKENEKNDAAPEVVQSLLKWGYEISKIIRTGQSYDFIMDDTYLKSDKNVRAIKIIGTHIYTVHNSSQKDTLEIPISMKDELGLQSVEDDCGFQSIHYQISGEAKQEIPLDLADEGDGARKNVTFTISIPPKKSVYLEYVSEGVFRSIDDYAWYS